MIKHLRLLPTMTDDDYAYRLRRGRRLLESGKELQVVCPLRGPEETGSANGEARLREAADALADISEVLAPPRKMGSRISMLLVPRAS